MASRVSSQIAINIAAGSVAGTTNYELDPIDMSNCDTIKATLDIDTIGVDAGDTFDIYLQSRDASGVWDDRMAFPQYLGTASDNEAYTMEIQKFGTLSDTEEGHEPQGSTGGSRLTANTVRNGHFPGVYRGNVTGGVGSTNTPGASWRVQIVGVDADNDAFITGTMWIQGDSAVPN